MQKVRKRYCRFINYSEKAKLISPLVHIGQFKIDCETILKETQLIATKKKDFSSAALSIEMNLHPAMISELEDVCNPSAFQCQGEEDIDCWEVPYSLPDDTNLVTLDAWKRLHDGRIDPVTLHRNRLLKSKYTEMSCALHAEASSIKAESSDDAVLCPEVLITVCVCYSWETRSSRTTGTDFYVLGTQKLTELRDRIQCPLDEQPVGNFTDIPDMKAKRKLKDVCSSSLFYIENTFYNDLRAPSNVDLSKYLREWDKEANDPFDSSTCVDMNKYCFNDLKVRLGCPYVFLHLGECEHLIVFKDIRLFSATDCQSRSKYPINTSRPKVAAYPCQVCQLYLSTWCTRWDELAEHDPGFFCDRCFKMLHYDKRGNKLGFFKAFKKVNAAGLDC